MEPIRVLHVVTYMGRGGLETMLMNYYRHIDRQKVQFDFLVHRDFEADYDKEIQSLGGHIYHVSRLVPWSSIYKNELKRFFRAHPEYKIVHVHQDCLSAVALKCAEECGIPVRIAHSHNSNQDKNLKYLIKRRYMKQIPYHATRLFACGKDAGDWMFQGREYQILNNAVDTSVYEFNPETAGKVRRALGIGTELVVGHVGRFHLQKNHTLLVDIFSEVVRKKPDAKLLLVGAGDGQAEIQKKVERMSLEKNVIFAGVRSDVNKLMQAMDVFVFPSLYEGLPVTMIEAQAAGIPCVISDGVPSECIVTNGLVSCKKLSDPITDWADCILSRAEKNRTNHSNEIKMVGYDIKEEAKKLETFYLQQNEE